MRTLSFIVTAVLAAALFQNSVFAGEGSSPAESLTNASKEFVGALTQLGATLDQRPAKLDASKWTSVKNGATEIKRKVASLQKTVEAARTTGEELGIANGRLQARLDALAHAYDRLAEEADAQAKQLSEPLASTVKREKMMWHTWATVVVSFKDHYSQTLERFQKQAEALKVVDPILARLAKGADGILEVASIGEGLDQQVSTLASLADELNGILATFGSLADQTKAALAQRDPSSSLEAAALASTGQGQYRTWTDDRGREVHARLVCASSKVAKLQVAGTGQVYDFPVAQLSDADQAAVRQVEILARVALAR